MENTKKNEEREGWELVLPSSGIRLPAF